jgi:outer membrane protein
MMKSLPVLLCAILMTFAPLTAAQATPTIAVINIQEIMRDSLAAKSVRQKLEAQQKSFQQEMSSKEKALQEEEKNLAQQRSVLSPEAFEKKVSEFKAKATTAQREVQTKKSKLDAAFGQALNEIQKNVVEISGSIAKERSYSVVMPTSQMLYAEPTLDITKEVLDRLNKKLPNVAVNF